jgi:hypothetical protein
MRRKMSLVTAGVLAVGALLGSLTTSGGLVAIAQAQSQPTTFVDRLTYSRAIEAAIWSRRLTGVKGLMDGLQRDAGVGYNDIGYFSKVQNSKFKWPTSNATTPYVVGYWNAEKEPVVVEIPPATPDVSVFGLPADAWQRPIADVGPDGVDGGRGAKYLLTTPEYRGPVPPGFIALQQTTYNGYMALRPVLKDNSAASLQKAVEYVKRVKIFPAVSGEQSTDALHRPLRQKGEPRLSARCGYVSHAPRDDPDRAHRGA